MKNITTLILLFSLNCFSQSEKINFHAGFSHFDDTDGYEIATSFTKELNRYLDIEFGLSYANSSDFPKDYSFGDYLNQSYFFSKSSIFTLHTLLHVTFVKTTRHNFSFFGGLGYMFIDSVDNLNTLIDQNNFIFESDVESDRTFSNLIGVRYTYFLNNYGFGLDARVNKPFSSNDDFFGQDNYWSVNLLISKRFLK
ncbi:hypothetical protein [Psychroflexus montanilacus]|uniref:hypothetical protein n=1 Tax=Psychroflexus montanilacus TaxID=2873598 RepID=UPI001CCB7956|nr:hypothetical protein [Psychroflexus montanilacus]MBZ9652232.1 hypothetical protein [Psychroflexus montanilacus]